MVDDKVYVKCLCSDLGQFSEGGFWVSCPRTLVPDFQSLSMKISQKHVNYYVYI